MEVVEPRFKEHMSHRKINNLLFLLQVSAEFLRATHRRTSKSILHLGGVNRHPYLSLLTTEDINCRICLAIQRCLL